MCLVIIKYILMKIKPSASNENLDARCISRFFLDLGLSELVCSLWGCDLRAEELLIFLKSQAFKNKSLHQENIFLLQICGDFLLEIET